MHVFAYLRSNKKKMENNEKQRPKAHCLVLAYPSQGHINPMVEFSKRLVHKGVKVTLVITKFYRSKFLLKDESLISSTSTVDLRTICDGCDDGGAAQAGSAEAHIRLCRQVGRDRFRKRDILDLSLQVGSRTLGELVEELCATGCRVDCIVYESFWTWALDVAKEFGIAGAVYFTQSCAVGNLFYQVHQGKLKLPVSGGHQILLPGLPPLELQDMPSYFLNAGGHDRDREVVCEQLANQFSNIHQADWVFCNTFYALEEEVVDWMTKIWPSIRTIGPSIPSMYLDKRLKHDKTHGFNMFNPNIDTRIMNWLNNRTQGSVVYVSFGSIVSLGADQMEQVACGLRKSNNHFLWVVRPSEEDKLPKDFVKETSDKGLVVSWCPQLEVLAHESVGCFLTHCGWNSTLEALSLAVPVVAMPQWADQFTNAKFIADVWKIGLKVPVDENGVATKQDVEHCIREVMEGEKGKEIKNNVCKWKRLAKEAVDECGSSDNNIDDFVAKLIHL